ncbi:MAG TPA: Sua5/YciO/YrdC/YwlC family protein, partial [Armatimonadota bacterium]|nr:Sua5/YciO/YrdC/YwlC family protein [Armatimonadota bacterium]
MAIVRREIIVRGIVQGVGFRPFVYRLAVPLGLAGSVQNKTSHVRIALEGDSARIEEFIQHLQADAPTLARIEEISIIDQPLLGDKTFSIIGSASGTTGEESIFISPDVAICVDCQHELLDVHDRRYRYPFINCTNCGPRFSIVTGMPYDRPQTTMRNFPLCPSCQQEYDSPADRRYHAQPTACAHCGPEVMLATGDGNIVARGDTAVTQASELLRDGAIIAIKGLGGYHLACDALNPHAVHELRKRKARDEKPFAVMAANLAVAKKYCTIDQAEIDVLCSSASPIVLLRKSSSRLPNEIAPGNPYLGVMLPYTPLHLLLFQSAPYELLIMTSGNISGEPVCFKDDAA